MQEESKSVEKNFSVDKLIYEVQTLASSFSLDSKSFSIKEIEKMVANQLVMQVHYRIYGREIDRVKYPANWKEAVKDRFLPKFLKRFFTVKYIEYRVDHLLPNLPVKKDEKPTIVVYRTS